MRLDINIFLSNCIHKRCIFYKYLINNLFYFLRWFTKCINFFKYTFSVWSSMKTRKSECSACPVLKYKSMRLTLGNRRNFWFENIKSHFVTSYWYLPIIVPKLVLHFPLIILHLINWTVYICKQKYTDILYTIVFFINIFCHIFKLLGLDT